MEAASRRNEAALTDEVLRDLEVASFQHAMTVLDAYLPVDDLAGRVESPTAERFRFRATPSLAFPASEVSKIRWQGDNKYLLEIYVNFLGLHGPSSPLPPHVTEQIVQSDHDPDSIREFFDLFNHRLIALFRRIWLRWRYGLRYRPGGTDAISRRLLCLAGFPFAIAETEDITDRPMLLPNLGLLSLYTRSADVIGAVLTHYFRLPMHVIEFVPRDVEIPDDQRGRLGVVDTVLGESFIAGKIVADTLGKFRVRAGPISLSQLRRLLPSGDLFVILRRLVELTQNEPLEWDLEAQLLAGEAPRWRLGAGELGWTTWIGEPPERPEPVVISVPDAVLAR